MEISQFFNYSPKQQRCLEKVISVDQPDSQRTKIRDLWCTCWVECHEAYETFALLLPLIVKTFEVILDGQQHKQYSTETPWNWDREIDSPEGKCCCAVTWSSSKHHRVTHRCKHWCGFRDVQLGLAKPSNSGCRVPSMDEKVAVREKPTRRTSTCLI